MPKERNKKLNDDTSLGQLVNTLSIKQVCGIVSVIALVVSTTYGFAYSSAQKKAAADMTLHTIEDKREELKIEQSQREKDAEINKLKLEKDAEINKLKFENEKLKDEINSGKVSRPKERILIVVVPKQVGTAD